MIGLDIKVEFPRKFKPNGPDLADLIKQSAWARGFAVAFARNIRRRRVKSGKGPDKGHAYPATGSRLVASRYPKGANGKETKEGATVYQSSRALHKGLGAKPGSFFVSGGMWAGLTVKVSSASRATINFRGRSQGQDVPKRKSGKRSVRGRKVSNSLKAATVFGTAKGQTGANAQGVHVLSAFQSETADMGIATTLLLGKAVALILGDDKKLQVSGASGQRLVKDILKAVKNRTSNV